MGKSKTFFSLGEILTETAKEFPSQTAIEEKTKSICYQELNSYSSKIAAFLLTKKDIKPGDKIGLYINKSINGIAAFFGILKAGLIYVPLDVNWPAKRCVYIFNECKIKYILSHSHYEDRLAEIFKTNSCLEEAVFLDKEEKAIKNIPYQRLPEVGRNSAAAVFYTSGSTGTPKGVIKGHRQEAEHIGSVWKSYRRLSCLVEKKDKYALYHPFCFCASFTDLLLMVGAAATVCILPEGICGFALTFKNFVKEKKITILELGSEALIWLVLYGELSKNEFPHLRAVISTGSKLPAKYLVSLAETLPKVKFFQNYGSTEAGIVTYHFINKNSFLKADSLPIGKPGVGVKTCLVDEAGGKLKKEPGKRGELYVASPALMKGYLSDSEATRKVLIKDPFTKKSGLTFYRTGDLIEIGPGGNYFYLGRRDNTVKVRGFRVNLEEVEAVLEKHLKIKKAVCIGVPDEKEKGLKLKAVIVPESGSRLQKEEVRSFCRGYLAAYMIPEQFEFRKFLPKTASAKIDRTKLYKEDKK